MTTATGYDPWRQADAPTKKWRRYDDSLLRSPTIVVTADPFLKVLPGYHIGSQATQAAFDESRDYLVRVFCEAIASTITDPSGPQRPVLEPYTPPAGWGKGGAVSAVDEAIYWAANNQLVVGVLGGLITDAVLKGTSIAVKQLREWWNSLGVPWYERRLPVMSPAILFAACALHAQVELEIDGPISFDIFPKSRLNADYPTVNDPFVVHLNHPGGEVLYSLTNRMHIVLITSREPSGDYEVDTDPWQELYGVR